MSQSSDDPEGSAEQPNTPKKLSDAFSTYTAPSFRFDGHNLAFKKISDSLTAGLKTQFASLAPKVSFTNQWLSSYFKFETPLKELAEKFNQSIQVQWEPVFKSLREIMRHVFPENWEDVRPPSLEIVEGILVDEGIPLVWVPRARGQDLRRRCRQGPDVSVQRVVTHYMS